MKVISQIIMKSFLVILLMTLLPHLAFALDVPQLRGRVNDYANMLSPAARERLEQVLADFESSDSTCLLYTSDAADE